MKRLFFVLILGLFFIIFSRSAVGQTRYATCDLCGYCPIVDNANGICTPITPPGNWQSCAECLYQDISPDVNSCNTLIVDPTTNLPPQPRQGTWYTMLGCINIGAGFQSEEAPAGLVQTLLRLIFAAAGGIAFIYIIYGAFLILTSQDEPERLNHGKRVVLGAVIGLIFALSSVFLTDLIGSKILKIPGFGSP